MLNANINTFEVVNQVEEFINTMFLNLVEFRVSNWIDVPEYT